MHSPARANKVLRKVGRKVSLCMLSAVLHTCTESVGKKHLGAWERALDHTTCSRGGNGLESDVLLLRVHCAVHLCAGAVGTSHGENFKPTFRNFQSAYGASETCSGTLIECPFDPCNSRRPPRQLFSDHFFQARGGAPYQRDQGNGGKPARGPPPGYEPLFEHSHGGDFGVGMRPAHRA